MKYIKLNIYLVLTFFLLTNFTDKNQPEKSFTWSGKFYNWGTVTIPVVLIEDDNESYTYNNLAVNSATAIGTAIPSFVSIEVALPATHPACRVRIMRNGVYVQCTNVNANNPLIVTYFDNNSVSAASYNIFYEEITC